jgi:hypothetical protein
MKRIMSVSVVTLLLTVLIQAASFADKAIIHDEAPTHPTYGTNPGAHEETDKVKVKGDTRKDGTKVEGDKRSKPVKEEKVEVKGYTKKDGTVVKGYTRKKATK